MFNNLFGLKLHQNQFRAWNELFISPPVRNRWPTISIPRRISPTTSEKDHQLEWNLISVKTKLSTILPCTVHFSKVLFCSRVCVCVCTCVWAWRHACMCVRVCVCVCVCVSKHFENCHYERKIKTSKALHLSFSIGNSIMGITLHCSKLNLELWAYWIKPIPQKRKKLIGCAEKLDAESRNTERFNLPFCQMTTGTLIRQNLLFSFILRKQSRLPRVWCKFYLNPINGKTQITGNHLSIWKNEAATENQ